MDGHQSHRAHKSSSHSSSTRSSKAVSSSTKPPAPTYASQVVFTAPASHTRAHTTSTTTTTPRGLMQMAMDDGMTPRTSSRKSKGKKALAEYDENATNYHPDYAAEDHDRV